MKYTKLKMGIRSHRISYRIVQKGTFAFFQELGAVVAHGLFALLSVAANEVGAPAPAT
jgi:hypothetical protein